MKFIEITNTAKVFPGEYILHVPSNQVVLCGAFSREANNIRVLARGKMFSDKIDNFKKINMSREERTESKKTRRCSSCKKV
jgi:N-acetylneuraminic acid mutarotase